MISDGKIWLDSIPFRNTGHMNRERIAREQVIEEMDDGLGMGSQVLAVYFVDDNHPNGPELHWITDNGVIICTNAINNNGMNISSKLIARGGQLYRYPDGGLDRWIACDIIYPDDGWRVPFYLKEKAREHERLGLNFTESSL